ncbi:MAG: hypothetical protein RLN60_00645 [Phycisphaerales bacterium]
MSDSKTVNEPVLTTVPMHVARPNEPLTVRISKNELCTASKKAAGYVRHVEFDVSGTPLENNCHAGQAIGVLVPGEDANGKPHKVRLYSLSSNVNGEDGKGRKYAVTVKRTIDEHWDDHSLFLGVASNYLSDRQPGDEIQVSGPNGKRFVLPEDPNAHDYMFFATGTGIAPFRGMVKHLIEMGCTSDITLVMGAPYTTDLLYHDYFLGVEQDHGNFRYLTAISRERQDDGHDRLYVQDRLQTDRDELLPQLASERNLIYICGLAGMELGIFQQLGFALQGEKLRQYIDADPEALRDIRGWDRRMLHKQVRPTRRVLMEVYA